MDPITLALLGAAAAGGLTQGIGGLLNSRRTEYDEQLEDRHADFLRQREGGGLGLTSDQRTAREQAYLNPVRTMAAQGRTRAEAMSAAMGQRSGGLYQQAQQAEAQQVGRALQEAQQRIAAENEAVAEAQRQEMLGLEATIAQREVDRRSGRAQAMGSIGQTLGQVGMAAAAAPGTFSAAGIGGSELAGNIIGDYEDQLREALAAGTLSYAQYSAIQRNPRQAARWLQSLGTAPAGRPPLTIGQNDIDQSMQWARAAEAAAYPQV